MKKSSTTPFFQKWQESFDDIIRYLRDTTEKECVLNNHDLENIDNASHNWVNDHLAKGYFDILERIYTKYSNSDEEKAVIRNAISGITFMIIECTQTDQIIPYAIQLLSAYKKCLDMKNSSGKINKQKLADYYYPHTEELKPINMLKTVQNYSKILFMYINNFLSFINDQLIACHVDTKYGIAINNYDIFEKQCYEYLDQTFVPHVNAAHDTFYSYTISLKNELANLNSREYADHVFQTSNAEMYVKTYTDIIITYYTKVEEAIKEFLSYVKMASSEKPEKESELKVNIDYFRLLKTRLAQYQTQLNKKIENSFKSLAPLIKYPVPGYIKEFSYPAFTFFDKDILRIIKELSLISADTPDEKVISCLHNNFKFPMKNEDVVKFLLMHEEILSNL